MILVLFLLGIIVLTLLFIIVLMLSTIKINIKKLEMQNILMPKISYDYDANICIYLFGKILILKININKSKLKKAKLVEKIKNSQFNTNLKLNGKIIDKIKVLSPKIEKLNLDLKLGTEDVLYTSFLIFSLSSAISLIIPHIVESKNIQNINYDLTPLYNEKNVFSLYLNSIIYAKIVNIINIIFIILQKRREDNNERTSNRRSYAHGYEQY